MGDPHVDHDRVSIFVVSQDVVVSKMMDQNLAFPGHQSSATCRTFEPPCHIRDPAALFDRRLHVGKQPRGH